MELPGWILLALGMIALGSPPARAEDADWRDCTRAVGDWQSSIRGCSRVLARGNTESLEKRWTAYFNRGVAYRHEDDNDRAIADYDQAIRLYPKDAHSYIYRGDAYHGKGDYDNAIANYDQAIRLDPKYEYTYYYRANIYYAKGDYDRAIADYGVAIRLDPKDAGFYGARGKAYYAKGDHDRAIADYDQAIRLDPKEARAYYNRGAAYLSKGDYDRAIADYDQEIRLAPKYAYPYSARGNVYYAKGDYDRAIADYDEAIRLNPKYADALAGRGRVFEQRGDAARARADFEAALAERPGDSEATAGLARLAKAAPPTPSSAPSAAVAPTAPIVAVGKRVALVIGNGAYQAVAALPNPPRDAQAMAEMFRAARFDDVKVETNVGVAAMRRALRTFADRAADADTAVVFFAGHGVEIGGRNYLIPVDAALGTDLDVKDEAVDLDRVLELLDPVKRLKLVILDACRENPFASRMRLTSASRSVGRGLAPPVEQTSNTLVAYAAKAGAVAADGDGRNSPFTTALLNNLTRPGLDVRIALGKVHDEVLQATGRRQEPFVYGALGGDTLALAPAR